MLSLCMIVKDEEHFLPRCLASVQGLADEIIIIDTGSQDKTKEIARKGTGHVFDFAWCDDFSAARNESLKYATGEWILILDADETIARQDHSKIKRLITQPEAEGYLLLQRNYIQSLRDLEYVFSPTLKVTATTESEQSFISTLGDKYEESKGMAGWWNAPIVRLFRNSPGVTFSGVVHEDVAPSLKGDIINSNIPIHHYGKLNAQLWQKKREVYQKLGEKKVQEKEDYHTCFELAVEYLAAKKWDLAKEALHKSTTLNKSFWASWFTLGSIHLLEDNCGEALSCLQKARNLNPQAIEIYKNLGVVHVKRKEFKHAIAAFVAGLNLNPSQPDVFHNMGLCYEEMGDSHRARLAFAKARELTSHHNQKKE